MFTLGFLMGCVAGYWWWVWLGSMYERPEPDKTPEHADAYVREQRHWKRSEP